MRFWRHDALIPPLERVEERLLDHLERRHELVLDLELARGENLTLGIT